VTAITQGANGSVAITNSGANVSYTPNANFNGADSFTYTISDGNGGTDTASVSITVTAVNDSPDAVNDSASVAEDSSANGLNVRANDNDPDGDSFSITAVNTRRKWNSVNYRWRNGYSSTLRMPTLTARIRSPIRFPTATAALVRRR
jgi:hypothetical protein